MNYVIIDASEISSIDFNQVLETSSETLKFSIDGSKSVLKYEGTQPSFLSGKTEHNHEEILSILSGPEWTSAEFI